MARDYVLSPRTAERLRAVLGRADLRGEPRRMFVDGSDQPLPDAVHILLVGPPHSAGPQPVRSGVYRLDGSAIDTGSQGSALYALAVECQPDGADLSAPHFAVAHIISGGTVAVE